ncbi:hypothetical protein LTR66_001541 [Elasticomyces elasticus]|nr:hypothetical protein LTR66_001541 [Elasticomyces elasticus]
MAGEKQFTTVNGSEAPALPSYTSRTMKSPSRFVRGPQCMQVEPLLPQQQSEKLVNMDAFLQSQEFTDESVRRLSDAVKIPSMSFDDMGKIGEDKRWDIFYDFAAYLNKTFPLAHEKLQVELINTHGLIFIWEGSDTSLKPTLLMAHQDVVPAPESTLDAWTHPPFDGFYDGKYIWGRGSSDCKNQLVGIMEAVELLLAAEFTPARTVVMSFGFDEEISGREGAGHLAPFLLERYGKDSFAAIVDEGAGIATVWGVKMASPGVAEKGYTDITITVRMPGGHSSIPSDHTSIGVLSELITLIEAHPYPTKLNKGNPYLGQLTCGAEHAPAFPKKLKKLLKHEKRGARTCKSKKHKKDALAIEAAKAGLGIQYLMQTSQAVDVINGGVKVNALPERASAIVNHRINIGEHPSDAQAKVAMLAKSVAKKYNLTLHAYGGEKEVPMSIRLSISATTLEPAPITPTEVDPVSAYAVLSATTRALYGKDLIVSPGIMTGNTDTRYYWDLSKHIFRFAPGWDGESEGLGNIHTVDEKISAKSHVAGAKWFSLFIRNMDQAALP